MSPLDSWKGADASYLQNIYRLCHQHPSLKLLNTLPILPEHSSRMKILEFGDKTIAELEIYKHPQLDAYWSTDKPPTCKGRLYLAEDISLPWISLLGNHFDIDPRFFAEYLKLDLDRTQNFLEGYHTMRRLPSLQSIATFTTFVYHEIRTFDRHAPRREEYEIRTRDNVARLVTTVDHHCERATGLIRRNMSVWWRPSTNATAPWEAIILVDPGASNAFGLRRWSELDAAKWSTTTCSNTPYLDGYLDFSAWPPPPRGKPGAAAHASILDDIAYYWQHASRADLAAALLDPRNAFIFAHRITASHWNLQLEYLVSVVSDLEKGMLKFEQMDAHPRAETIVNEVRALRTLLSDVNSWRRRVYFYLEQMRWNIEGLCVPGAGDSVGRTIGHDSAVSFGEDEGKEGSGSGSGVAIKRGRYTSPSAAAALAHTDFAPLLTSLRLTQQRIQSLLPVVMGAFSLLEAQHSVLKADLTIRLSSVALVFVPLGFTSSLLSMSDNFLPGKSLFWVFWVVSVPLIIGLFWWAYWVQVGRVKRVGMREMGRRLKKRAEGLG
ncbi:hypothetical protein DPSP01_007725 [Paraphaeosphaeria sporulosa]|uniref:Cora-domain-containing protein n=1 Tax=Paraphaeosphaeria sporulosa TaxID=1460663 RepID=A0A177CBU9_9PLEO|nr:uncharacterized protein CC84DRAFT_1260121 [Paraphaeosphaeria sporulosa]OAG04806.1 hypothetical protein CC84DRAFT_1260121 [Paraphaeosphaeria sporulosa]